MPEVTDMIFTLRRQPVGWALRVDWRREGQQGYQAHPTVYRGLVMAELIDIVESTLENISPSQGSLFD
uniref:Uncharacterized protein n=1 Tax=uncultured prokaryote TaxID=198431 RepID=A0A0H5Q263_9ZZZZ|nr:hypothetical protein [uncultured prokaryote]